MKYYNIYYKYNKINKYPLLKSEIEDILKQKCVIYNHNKINVKSLNIIECTII